MGRGSPQALNMKATAIEVPTRGIGVHQGQMSVKCLRDVCENETFYRTQYT